MITNTVAKKFNLNMSRHQTKHRLNLMFKSLRTCIELLIIEDGIINNKTWNIGK